MADRKHTPGLSVRDEHGFATIRIAAKGRWDGAELSLVRDTLARLVQREHRRSIGIELQGVEFLPSGFFGALFETFDMGVRIRLYAPERRVRNMIWFRQFFVSDGHARFHMADSEPLNERQAAEWSRDDWEVSRSVAASL